MGLTISPDTSKKKKSVSTQCWQKTSDFQKGKKPSTKVGREKKEREGEKENKKRKQDRTRTLEREL